MPTVDPDQAVSSSPLGGSAQDQELVYLDNAATTPMRPAAKESWLAANEFTGNPSSLHAAGRRSRRLVEESRESIADFLSVRPNDVVFTSGGTEADNIAIKGLYWAVREQDPQRNIIVLPRIEHHAVLDAATWLASADGAQLEWIPTNSDGVVDSGWLVDYLAHHHNRIALCTVMWANNETGVIQPIEQISQACEQWNIAFHCDGVQAAAWFPQEAPWRSAVSSLAVSAHKFGGPVGVGVLVVNGATPTPLTHGGGQEINIRSGTVAAALISSAATALLEVGAHHEVEGRRLRDLQRRLERELVQLDPTAVVFGQSGPRLPTISSIAFPGCKADGLLMLLDAANVACSTGSACTAGVPRPSHVLLAMGVSEPLAQSTLRFSLGWNSTEADIEQLLRVLPGVLDRARARRR